MGTDEYNGWPNRETWATSLHLSNDEGLCEMVNELARRSLEDPEDSAPHVLADSIEDLFNEWEADMIDGEPQTREMRMMLTDIGSLYRVDFDAVASNWLEGVDEGPR